MRNRQRDSGQLGLWKPITPNQSIMTRHTFSRINKWHFQSNHKLSSNYITACRNTCREAGFQATDPFSYNYYYNKKNTHLKTLADTHLCYEFFHLAAFLKRCCNISFKQTVNFIKIHTLTAVHGLPMIKHTLREGLTSGMRPQLAVETK